MAKNNNEGDGKLYVMPKVSVIIQKGGNVPMSAYSYSYSEYMQRPQRTLFGIITAAFTWVIGFCLAIVLFAVPVALTSVILVNTMSSQGVVTIRTQDVPSDGTSHYMQNKELRLIEPADR